ncbi:MAG: hypothetical protein WCK63_01280 [Betaproteobacteria bacterium]
MHSDKEDCLEARMDDHLAKSISSEQIRACLARADVIPDSGAQAAVR